MNAKSTKQGGTIPRASHLEADCTRFLLRPFEHNYETTGTRMQLESRGRGKQSSRTSGSRGSGPRLGRSYRAPWPARFPHSVVKTRSFYDTDSSFGGWLHPGTPPNKDMPGDWGWAQDTQARYAHELRNFTFIVNRTQPHVVNRNSLARERVSCSP
jgi:hypothetical protein